MVILNPSLSYPGPRDRLAMGRQGAPHSASDRLSVLLLALQRIAEAAARAEDGERLFPVLADQLAAVAGASATVATAAPELGALRLRAGTGLFAGREGALLPVRGSFAGVAFRAGMERGTEDAATDPAAAAAERGWTAGPYLAVPLVADGRVAGVALLARSPGEPPFDAAALAALRLAAGAAAPAVAAAEAPRRLREEAGAVRALRKEMAAPLATVARRARELRGHRVVQAEPALEAAARALDEAAGRLRELAARDG